jgi:hypothetical protein
MLISSYRNSFTYDEVISWYTLIMLKMSSVKNIFNTPYLASFQVEQHYSTLQSISCFILCSHGYRDPVTHCHYPQYRIASLEKDHHSKYGF